jgi:two-component system LytT family response regulator
MLRTLIIDDEAHICPQVSMVGEATGVADGSIAIMELHPDLVFLDMNLSDGNAFDMLHTLKSYDFGVVFISTFDRETIRALKLCGLEYLQKPFSPIELVEVVRRAEKHDISNLALQLNALEENLLNLS